jgi:D-alanyl-D-alanine carboxypeptidase/D-alanyl-D-alanine-endopeptidase (penicillin-binding protein 4)
MFKKPIYLIFLLLLNACGMQHTIQKQAKQHLLKEDALKNAHIGIAIHDASAEKFIYQYQADKLFVPASNVKIFTTYAALKYLPEQLPAAMLTDLDTAVLVTPMGDPSFLHPDFTAHPLLDKLKSIQKPLYIRNDNWFSPALGAGWSVEDYNEHYQAERNAFPVFGNLIHWYQERSVKENPTNPQDTIDIFIYSNPEINWPVDFGKSNTSFQVKRNEHQNTFLLSEGKEKTASQSVPFITNGLQNGLLLLKDSLGKEIQIAENDLLKQAINKPTELVYSQPRDSVLKKMMYRSDNFYADQSLEMISQSLLNKMDEAAIIQLLLNQDFKTLPVKPRWVDGSGLSRYNQFSPSDMIAVLTQLKAEQPWDKIKNLFPKAGVGTLRSLNSSAGDFVYAKTGSMGGVYCLSGYVLTKKGKWLSFSIMVNNHNTSNSIVRKKIESFLQAL